MNGAWRSGLRFSALAAALTMIHGCGTLPDQGLAREAMERLFPLVDDIVKRIIMPVALAREAQRTGGWFAFWRSDPNLTDTVPVVGFAVGTIFFPNRKRIWRSRWP